MRWLFLIGGFTLVAFFFREHSTGSSFAAAVVYVIFSAMGKDNRRDA